ncbi:hypothetical protein LSTR_LSTR004424 [Laodelphax striatellus]|uniref:F-box domain-containing protein n=1 Tax=Laodelphax striatellus TaxID=195883 RepID=A0A482X961_LAOST|nr:hypothetical protein LSTR_LSTR004424 [Laodelphax striatellus]
MNSSVMATQLSAVGGGGGVGGRLSPMVCPLAKLGRTSPDEQQPPPPPLPPPHPPPPRSSCSYNLRPTAAASSPTQLDCPGYSIRENQSIGHDKTQLDCSYMRGVSSPTAQLDCSYKIRGVSSPTAQLDCSYNKMRGVSSPTAQLDCSYNKMRGVSSPTAQLDCSSGYRASPYSLLRCSSPSATSLGRAASPLNQVDQGYHTLVSPCCWPDTSNTATAPLIAKSKRSIVKSSYFDRLPDDVVLKMFGWLSSSELCVCARVCKRWQSLAWDASLWRTVWLAGEGRCGDRALRCILRRLCGRSVQRLVLADGARLSDKGLSLVARRCPSLTHLQLHGCAAVTNAALFELVARCPSLHHLDITGCIQISCISMGGVPGPGPELQQRRLLLQYLDLTDCAAVDDSGLRVIVRNCPQLVYLYLRRCLKVTDAGIKFVPSFCSTLRELSVSDCSLVTDFGLYELAKLGATLRYLSVAKCTQVSDAGLKVIAKRCYKLRYLNARGCEAVSDDAITVLARSCPRLRALDIGKCDVSDAGLRALAESCMNLKKLSLRQCDLVTDRGVQCVAYYCRGLTQLNIQDCQISLEGYKAVKKYCKRCIIEHTNPGFF